MKYQSQLKIAKSQRARRGKNETQTENWGRLGPRNKGYGKGNHLFGL